MLVPRKDCAEKITACSYIVKYLLFIALIIFSSSEIYMPVE